MRRFLLICCCSIITACAAPTRFTISPLAAPPQSAAKSIACGNVLKESIDNEILRINSNINARTSGTAWVSGIGGLVGSFSGFMAGAMTPTDTKSAYGYVAGGTSILAGGIAGLLLIGQSNDQSASSALTGLNKAWVLIISTSPSDADAWKGLTDFVSSAYDVRNKFNLSFGIPDIPCP